MVCEKCKVTVTSFIDEKLSGEAKKLFTYDFGEEANFYKNFYKKKYHADSVPVVLAVYCLLWGEKLFPDIEGCKVEARKFASSSDPSRKKKSGYYSGDTLNTSKSTFGKYSPFPQSKWGELLPKIDEFQEELHYTLGNFMPLPVKTEHGKYQSLNQSRGDYHGLKDYFDLYLMSVQSFCRKDLQSVPVKFRRTLERNRDYYKRFNNDFDDYISSNFLQSYINNTKVVEAFPHHDYRNVLPTNEDEANDYLDYAKRNIFDRSYTMKKVLFPMLGISEDLIEGPTYEITDIPK